LPSIRTVERRIVVSQNIIVKKTDIIIIIITTILSDSGGRQPYLCLGPKKHIEKYIIFFSCLNNM